MYVKASFVVLIKQLCAAENKVFEIKQEMRCETKKCIELQSWILLFSGCELHHTETFFSVLE